MASTYKLLNHNEPLSVEEIRKLYSGNWVYIVNSEFSSGRNLSSGIPVVCGDCAYAGAEDIFTSSLNQKSMVNILNSIYLNLN